jgi:hypothetical protein
MAKSLILQAFSGSSAMLFDYEKILRGYLFGVMDAEGIDYCSEAHGLSDEERAELSRIADLAHDDLRRCRTEEELMRPNEL